MNEHMLPEDLSRWPANPFELLGVPPGVGERDLRRAYTRLIRVYKPEQFPEHFRRIREAYEAARHFVPFFTPSEAPVAPPVPSTESPSAPQDVPAEELPAPRPLPRSFEEELEEAWSWAVGGDEARAYSRLLELQSRYPERTEICLRLYCLLGVAPELDPRRTPCHFLVQGLRQTGGSGPCHELYRRAVEDNPAEALTEGFAELFHATTQPGLLATFVQWRWSAAGLLGRFDVIGEDLPALRARLAVEQDEMWLRLLASAADQLAWFPAPTASADFPECVHEAASHKHLQLRCADIFDRLEYLERIAAGWRSLRKKGQVSAQLLELLARFWTRPFPEIRRSVTALLAAIATEPKAWLADLDLMNQVSPPLLSLVGHLLNSYEATVTLDAEGRKSAELAGLARHFLEEHGGLSYRVLRPRILAFCLREVIPPELVAQVALSQIVVLPNLRLQKLVNDWPLRHVYRACSLFRS
jgi:hypothetical protein